MLTIEIHDVDADGCLAVELSQVLRIIEPCGRQLTWSIHDLEAMGDITSRWPEGVVELERKIADAPQGLPFTWDDVVEVARLTEQIINCDIRGLGSDGSLVMRIRFVDSSLCQFQASHVASFGQFFKVYKDVSGPFSTDKNANG
jgi:hypothetical protein